MLVIKAMIKLSKENGWLQLITKVFIIFTLYNGVLLYEWLMQANGLYLQTILIAIYVNTAATLNPTILRKITLTVI